MVVLVWAEMVTDRIATGKVMGCLLKGETPEEQEIQVLTDLVAPEVQRPHQPEP